MQDQCQCDSEIIIQSMDDVASLIHSQAFITGLIYTIKMLTDVRE